MKSARLGRLAFVAAAVALIVPTAAQADAVTNWNRIATQTLVTFTGPGSGAPPALQVNMGMTQGAVYDAVNAIQRRHRPIVLHKKFHSWASIDAAVATAAHDVLSSLVNDPRVAVTPPATKASLTLTLDNELASSLAGIPNGREKTEGREAGTAAADAMIADRADDGRFGPSPWISNPAPGHWQPLGGALDPTPWVANVRPFLIRSTSQFRTAGPLDMSTAQWATEFNEVKRLGATDSESRPGGRTPEQTQIALFWQSAGGPALLWNPVARQLVDNPAYGVGVVESAFLFGLMNLTGADAAINCWNDKYYWDFWRPWNAIPRAEEDGNAATSPEATWAALLTAPYPEHPSGHLCLDGAMLTSMQMFFGTDLADYSVKSSRSPTPRVFHSFSAPLNEIVEARIWAGLHYRTGDVQGLNLGREVAHWGQIHYFEPLG